MTEDEARAWLAARGWLDGVALERLERIAAMVMEENARQNLVAASTLPHMWSRHIVDSAQLLVLAQARADEGLWVDLGSGGGFPGLVIAALRPAPILMVETRGLRARFLERCIGDLGLAHASVLQSRVERVVLDAPAAILSARAFASLDSTLAIASHLCDQNSVWLLPKGRNAQLELVTAGQQWQAVFHVEQSVTDPESAIITASGVKRRYAARPGPKSTRSRKA
ncbi:hypothetical protein BH10PSE13_BH10PSE13_00680 [soil metagenome]